MGDWITRNITQQIELLQRHAEILEVLSKSDKPLGIIKLSKMTGHSPHLVRYSLRELQNADVIKPTPRGAGLSPNAKSFLANMNREIAQINSDLASFSAKLKTISKK